MSKISKLKEQERRLAFFDQEEDHYEEKKIGDDWWIKSWNGGNKKWQVSRFSERSYNNYKSFNKGESYGDNQQLFENAINKED